MHLIFLSILLFSVWSLAFPLGKWMLSFGSPLLLTAVRMTIAGALLTGYLFFKNRSSLRLSARGWLSMVWLALTSVVLSNVLELWGMQSVLPAKACFIYSLSPFFTALLSYLHFGEKMTTKKWLGLSLGFLGFLPPLLWDEKGNAPISLFYGFSWGEIAVIGAAFFAVWGWVFLRLIVKDEKIPHLVANGWSMLLGGVFSLTFCFIFEKDPTSLLNEATAWPILWGTAAMIVISNLFGYNLYGYLLSRYSATLLSLFGLLSPLFASLHSWMLFGDLPSPLMLGSTLIILAGLRIFYYEEKKLGYAA